MLGLAGLDEEVSGTSLQGLHGQLGLGKGRHHHQWQLWQPLVHGPQQGHAVHAR